MSSDHNAAVEEMLAARNAMLEEHGGDPELWFEALGIDPVAVLHIAQTVAAIAVANSGSTYAAAGTSYSMGFALGATVMDARAKAARA